MADTPDTRLIEEIATKLAGNKEADPVLQKKLSKLVLDRALDLSEFIIDRAASTKLRKVVGEQ